jgi:hypothetical protein
MPSQSVRKLRTVLDAIVIYAVTTGPLFAQSPSSSADAPVISECANALEQLSTLQVALPAYKQLDGDHRLYLDDKDRPAEIARFQKIIAASCSSDSRTRTSEQAAAERLRTGRSPECIFQRDKLDMMEKPGSRDDAAEIAAQRIRVAKQCPAVPMADSWLLQPVWNTTS